MNATPACPIAADDDTVHRYVAGTLAREETQTFEMHLLGCGACQDAVEQGAAVRAALRAGVRPTWRPLRWMVPLAAAAAAVWFLAPSTDPLRDLARVDDVPAFEGVPVRADPDSLTALADRGMAAYAAGAYEQAAELLAAARGSGAGPALHFFLGIAQLKSGSADSAAASLALASEPPSNPYAPEARFYRAKAWLAMGQADSALAQLAAVPARAGVVATHAAALADSIRQVAPR